MHTSNWQREQLCR